MHQAPHVHPLSAHDLQAGPRVLGVQIQQLKPIHPDRAWDALHHLAPASLAIQALSAQLDRGMHRRNLHDRSHESGEDRLQIDGAELRGAGDRRDRTLAVVCVRCRAQLDGREIGLGPLVDELRQPRRPAQQDGQDPVRRRVQGAAMPDRVDGAEAADQPHQREGGGTHGLVQVEDAGNHRSRLQDWLSRARAAARTSASA